MPKAYWIVAYRSISDPAALASYAKISLPAITAGGGKSSRVAHRPKLLRTD